MSQTFLHSEKNKGLNVAIHDDAIWTKNDKIKKKKEKTCKVLLKMSTKDYGMLLSTFLDSKASSNPSWKWEKFKKVDISVV